MGAQVWLRGNQLLNDDDLSELALLWAVSSLPSLDVLLLLLPDDTHNLQLCRMLARSAELLPAIHQRQTAAPQLVVRVSDAAFEARYRAEADALAALTRRPPTRRRQRARRRRPLAGRARARRGARTCSK